VSWPTGLVPAFGRAHCALCDIIHGLVREKADWKTGYAGLPVAFDTFQRSDHPDPLRRALGNVVPVVVAETPGVFIKLLGPNEPSECAGSVDRMVSAIESAVSRAGLRWPTESATSPRVLVGTISVSRNNGCAGVDHGMSKRAVRRNGGRALTQQTPYSERDERSQPASDQ
jgi:hypothetical protein